MKTTFIWAKEGDANTKLFHSLMNARKVKNVITKLELEDGSFIDREEDVVREVQVSFRVCMSRRIYVFVASRALSGSLSHCF